MRLPRVPSLSPASVRINVKFYSINHDALSVCLLLSPWIHQPCQPRTTTPIHSQRSWNSGVPSSPQESRPHQGCSLRENLNLIRSITAVLSIGPLVLPKGGDGGSNAKYEYLPLSKAPMFKTNQLTQIDIQPDLSCPANEQIIDN